MLRGLVRLGRVYTAGEWTESRLYVQFGERMNKRQDTMLWTMWAVYRK